MRELGSFRGFGSWVGYKLGSFCIFWGGAGWPWGQIGFVSHKQGAVGHLVCGNWVRFVFFVFHRSVAVGIGFVSYNGGTACRARTGIGFVLGVWIAGVCPGTGAGRMTGVVGLGSFRIVGAQHAVPVGGLCRQSGGWMVVK